MTPIRILLADDHTLVRLPASLSPELLEKLRGVIVRGQALAISRADERSKDGPKDGSKPLRRQVRAEGGRGPR